MASELSHGFADWVNHRFSAGVCVAAHGNRKERTGSYRYCPTARFLLQSDCNKNPMRKQDTVNFPIINLGSATLDLASTITSTLANVTYLLQSWGSM